MSGPLGGDIRIAVPSPSRDVPTRAWVITLGGHARSLGSAYPLFGERGHPAWAISSSSMSSRRSSSSFRFRSRRLLYGRRPGRACRATTFSCPRPRPPQAGRASAPTTLRPALRQQGAGQVSGRPTARRSTRCRSPRERARPRNQPRARASSDAVAVEPQRFVFQEPAPAVRRRRCRTRADAGTHRYALLMLGNRLLPAGAL